MIYWCKNHAYCLVNTKMIFSLGSMARVKRGRKRWRWWRSITSSYRMQRRRNDGHRRGSTTVALPTPGKTSMRPCCSSKSTMYGKIHKKIYPLLNQIPFVKNSKSQFDTFDTVGSRSGDARSLAALRGDLCHRTRSGQQWTWSESRNRNQNQQPDGQMETPEGVSCSPTDQDRRRNRSTPGQIDHAIHWWVKDFFFFIQFS